MCAQAVPVLVARTREQWPYRLASDRAMKTASDVVLVASEDMTASEAEIFWITLGSVSKLIGVNSKVSILCRNLGLWCRHTSIGINSKVVQVQYHWIQTSWLDSKCRWNFGVDGNQHRHEEPKFLQKISAYISSEVTSGLGWIWNQKSYYPGINVHITSFGGLWGHSGLQMASEAMAASKQPQRSLWP